MTNAKDSIDREDHNQVSDTEPGPEGAVNKARLRKAEKALQVGQQVDIFELDPFFDMMLAWVYGGKVGPRPIPSPFEPQEPLSRQIHEKGQAALVKIYSGANWEKTLAQDLDVEDIPLEEGVDPWVIYLERYLTCARDAYPGADQLTAEEKNLLAKARREAQDSGNDAGGLTGDQK